MKLLEIIKRIYKDKSNPLLRLLFVVVLFVIPFSFAFAVNFPPTFYYQAVLKNSSGTYLGSSSGTSYYFKFSIWDSATVGSGTRLWPSTTPGTTTLSVRSGVFSVNIGDTANSYPDALTYNFNSPTVVYLQTEVSSDNISSETISPRQQINQNPSSFGTSTPIGISVVSIAATTTNSVGLTIQGFLNQTANLFQVRSDSNTNLFSINNTGGLFASSTLQVTGATRLYSTLTGTSASFSDTTATSTFSGLVDISKNLVVGNFISASTFNATSTTATSTFNGGLSLGTLGITSTTASSTIAGGLVITGGGVKLSTVLNCNGNSTLDTDSSGNIVCGTDQGSQTPWTSNVDAGGYNLTNGGSFTFTNFSATSTTAFSSIASFLSIGTTTLTTQSALFTVSATSSLSNRSLLSIFAEPALSGTTTAFTILSNGNVGIGSTTPGTTLGVNGAAVIAGALTVQSFTATSTTATSTLLGFADISKNLVVGGFLSASIFNATSTTATSTFNGGLSLGTLGITSTTASSTIAGGLVITGGGVKLSTVLNCNGNSTLDTDSSGNIVCGTDQGSQTPWTSNVDAGGYNLTNGGSFTFTNFSATSTTAFSSIASFLSIGTTTLTTQSALFTVSATSSLSNRSLLSIFAEPALSGTTTAFTILSNGNVGIGSTTPGTTLGVNGAAVIAGALTVQSFTATSTTATSTLLGFADISKNLVVGGFLSASIFNATSTTATSTFNGGLSLGTLGITSTTASSTIAGGLVITGGGVKLSTVLNCNGNSTLDTDSSGNIVCGTDQGSQTPWTSNVDAGGYNLTNGGSFTFTNFSATSTTAFSSIASFLSIGTTTLTTQSALFTVSATSSLSNRSLLSIFAEPALSGTTTAFTILSNGNVGIGSTTPGTTLGVNGAAVIAGALTVQSFTATSTTATSTLLGFADISKNLVVGGFLSASIFNATSTTATSTFNGGLSLGTLGITSTTASSTIAGGLVITGGGVKLSTVLNCNGNSTLDTDSSGNIVCGTDQGSQTPWTSNVDAGGYNLTNGGSFTFTNFSATSTTAFSSIASFLSIGTTTLTTQSALFTVSATSSLSNRSLLSIFAEPALSGTTTAFTILSNGNVGIGSTTPGTTLGVNGAAVIAGALTVQSFTATSTTATSTLLGFADISKNLVVGGFLSASIFNATSTTATSTFNGGLSLGTLGITSTTASSTIAGGLVITGGGLKLSTVLNCNGNSTLDTDSSGNIVCGTDQGSTPWTSTIDAGGYNLTNGGSFTFTNFSATSTTLLSSVASFLSIGTTTLTTQSALFTVSATSSLSNRSLLSVFAEPFLGATTTALTISSSGNVGIGSTTPGTPLGVNGAAVIAGALTVQSFTATSTTATSTLLGFADISKNLVVGGFLSASIFNATSTTATSTFNGGLSLGTLDITSTTASSTIAGGLVITGGGLKLSTVLNCNGNSTLDTDSSGNIVCGTDQGSTPWTSTIDAGGYNLTNGGSFTFTNFSATSTTLLSSVASFLSIGTTTLTTQSALFTVSATSSLSNRSLLSVFAEPFLGATTTALTISSSGNVGIGSTTPGTPLGVNGAAVIAGALTVQSFTATSTTATSTLLGFADISKNLVVGGFLSASIFNATSTTATSTFNGGLSLGTLGITSTTASSTIAGGLVITGGGLRLSTLVSCNGSNAVNTDSVGNVICGATSAGAGGPNVSKFSTSTVDSFAIYAAGVSRTGFGTTSPWAVLSVSATSTYSNFPLFAISTSTQTSTTTAFIIDSNGKVGIGTTTPGTELSVAGLISSGYINTFNASATSTIAGGFNVFAINQTGTATSTFARGIQLTDGCFRGVDGNCIVNGAATLSGGAANAITFWTSSSAVSSNPLYNWNNSIGTMGIGTSSPASILTVSATSSLSNRSLLSIFAEPALSGTTTAFTILSNGNVGIGSTTPGTTLGVNGAAVIAGALTVQSFTATSTTATSTLSGFADISKNLVVGGFLSASIFNATSTTATSTLSGFADISKNLVVGGFLSASIFNATSTTATSTFAGGITTNLLSVTSTVASSTFSNGVNLTGGCITYNSGTCLAPTASGSTGQLSFYSGTNSLSATSSLFINTTSYVGLGTTTPQSLLALHGTAPVITLGDTQSNSREFQIRNGALNAGTFDIFDLGNNASRFVIDASGHIGIGSGATTSQTAALYVTASSTAQTITKTTSADFSISGAATTGGVSTTSGQILLPYTASSTIIAGGAGNFVAGPSFTTGIALADQGSHSLLRPDGKYLILMGDPLLTTQIYDPVTNTMTAGPSLTQNKCSNGCHSILRPDGKFLIIQGVGTTTQIYDPIANTFTTGPSFVTGGAIGSGAHSIRRPDGKWLVIKGNGTAVTQIYDPSIGSTTGSFVAGPSFESGVADYGSLSIQRPDGKFWLMQGGASANTQIYDPVANVFTAGGAFIYRLGYLGAHAFQRPDGKFLIMMGNAYDITQLYDPVNHVVSLGPSLINGATSWIGAHSLQRPDGRWLVFPGNSNTTQIYDPSFGSSTGAFISGPSITTGSINIGSHSIHRPDGKYLVIVGGTTATTQIYDAGWTTSGSYETEAMNSPKLNIASVLKWNQNAEGIIEAAVRTAGTSAGLSSATYATTTNGGYIYPASGDTWVQVRFTLTRSIPQNNQPQQPIYNKNVSIGDADVKYFRNFDVPTVYDFTVDNSSVFTKSGADFALGHATSTSLGNATSTTPTLNNLIAGDGQGGLILPYGFVSASTTATSTTLGNFFSSSTPVIGTVRGPKVGSGAHAIQRPDGKFLVILGGLTGTSSTAIYDPFASTSAPAFIAGPSIVGTAANLASAGSHSFQRSDGNFLVVLGSNTSNTSIYNPIANTFVAGPALGNGALASSSVSIMRPDGKFLILQGNNTASTTIYDPQANSFVRGPDLVNASTTANVAQAGVHAIQRPDGKFIFILGNQSRNTSIYDPVANTFVEGPYMIGTVNSSADYGAHSIQRTDGKFLVILGNNRSDTSIYDPVANTFVAGPAVVGTSASNVRQGAHSIQRADGKFLVFLGNNTSDTSIYDSVANIFNPGPAIGDLASLGAHSIQLSDGKYLTILGNNLASTSLYSAGWVTSGFYQSEMINNTGLNAQSALVWTGNADAFKAGAVSFQVRTALTAAFLATSSWRTLPNSGALINPTSGDVWMQVRINMQRSIPQQPGAGKNVWLGESSTVYNRLPLQAGAGIPSVNIAQVFTQPIINSYKVINVDNTDLASFALNGQSLFRFSAGGDAYTQPGGTWNSGGADVAEYFPTDDFTLEPGDIVSVSPNDSKGLISKSTSSYDRTIVGIITTTPGIKLGSDIQGGNAGKQAVALAGRVPIKVNFESGPIKKGDPLTSSSVPGVAMKATDAGRVVALALEDFTSEMFNNGVKSILAYVNPHEGVGEGGFFSTAGKKLSLWNSAVNNSLSSMNMFTKEGKLGVGTDHPDAVLSISNPSSSGQASTLLSITGSEDQQAPLLRIDSIFKSKDLETGEASTSLQTILTVTSEGLLGLGTSTPSSLLHLVGYNPTITLTDSSSITPWLVGNNLSNFYVGTSSSNAILSISPSGVVSIGSSSSTNSTLLSVNGSSNQTTDLFQINRQLATDSNSEYQGEHNQQLQTAFTVAASGLVGIGTTSPWRTLSVTGTVALSGLTALSATSTSSSNLCINNSTFEITQSSLFVGCIGSSEHIKHNIETLNVDPISIIKQLRLISFVYNQDPTQTVTWGFSAEQANSIDSHLAATDASGHAYNIVDRAFLAAIVGAEQKLLQSIDISNAPISTPTLYITASSTVAIGTSTPDLAYKLYVEGDAAATSFVNISTSDAKKDIEYLSEEDKRSIGERIRNIKIAEYRYNGETVTAPLRFGLIAEDAPPEILSANGKGVDVYKFSTFLLAGIQEQDKRITNQELRITNLEQLVASVSTSSPSSVSVQGVFDYLTGLGVKISAGVAEFRDLVADKLIVNSFDASQGITMKDENGQLGCVTIEDVTTDGVRVTVGACSSAPALGTASSSPETSEPTNLQTDLTPPTITLIGANPAEISKGSPYIDLGVTVDDNIDHNLGFHSTGEVDVNTLGTYTIYYTATDQAGNTATTTRAVNVYDPYQSVVIDNVATSTESSP